jgi:hypothetical protein
MVAMQRGQMESREPSRLRRWGYCMGSLSNVLVICVQASKVWNCDQAGANPCAMRSVAWFSAPLLPRNRDLPMRHDEVPVEQTQN